MEINEILISIESSLTNLFYNNEFDYITFLSLILIKLHATIVKQLSYNY